VRVNQPALGVLDTGLTTHHDKLFDRAMSLLPTIMWLNIRSLLIRSTCARRLRRQMKRFKSAGQAQRFLSAHDQINNLFHLRRDHVTAAEHRAARTQTFRVWAEISSIAAKA
jgi:hypothetical protein